MREPADQNLSFDPRSWDVGPRARAPSSPPQEPTARVGSAVARPLSGPPVPLQAVGMVVAVAIALAGAVAAYRARPPVTAEKTRQVPIAGAAVTKAGADSRTLVVPGADDLVPSLLATGIAPDQAAEAARLVRRGLGGEGELRLVLAIDRAGPVRLGALTATRADGSGVALTASAAGFDATRLDAKLVRSVDFVRGELDGQSFYSSAVAAGVADVLVGEFANVFRYDFDMQREVHPGDVFEAGFEQRRNAAGEPVGAPVLVYAALSTAAKSRALYRFQPDQGEAEWVDSGGRSNRRSLMRTPVEAARISSGFGPRGHPILGFVKMHRGTDFAAPTGTPIFAAGDAVVTVAGFRGANGNFVRLRHDNGWETLYLHMNRIADGIAPGARIGQGQQIGEVGTTGRSTGPHLHYEVHVAGQAVDPLSIETGGGRTLAGAVLKAFRGLRDRIDARRAATG